ncbi:cysteine--tRNA ligase [Mesoplasma photuris]|uniref:cysteine--tRNA ligase n=1 Tax=Mesoplasma photuris TaxID=217731 RepID=UPI0004E14369|nr:cysteine--tRNA ligase [Mesoplasma photuris]
MKTNTSFSKPLQDLQRREMNIYMCGPTVYNFIHIGNARPAVLADMFVRFLKSKKTQINYLQNITDIDDKIINKAIEENISEKEIAEKFTKAYLEDLDSLNVMRPNKITPISEKMPEMISFIEQLINNGSAYEVDGDVYFDVLKFENQYGKLANKKLDELIVGERIAVDVKKKSPYDFSIWKKTNVGITWDSPFGKGRPGWHTECAVLIDDYFNSQTIDIHFGGIDLKFPHHENERIQFIAKNQAEIANVWMHNGHVTIEDEKMSKSLGNTILVRDFVSENGPDLLRWVFMTTHFRQPLNINQDIIEQGKKFFVKLINIKKKITMALISGLVNQTNEIDETSYNTFSEYMRNDLNTSMVLTLIDEMMKDINKDNNILKYNTLQIICNEILGFIFDFKITFTKDDQNLYQKWKQFLVEKDFDAADQIREQLIERNLI